MFIGEYQHTIDAKGRMFTPAKFREELGDTFIATIGLDGCLFVYPIEVFNRCKEKLNELSMDTPQERKFYRAFFAGARECEPDKQGRILIPQNLRNYAKLDKDVVVVGVFDRVEIWDAETWKMSQGVDSFTPEEYSDNMKMLGF